MSPTPHPRRSVASSRPLPHSVAPTLPLEPVTSPDGAELDPVALGCSCVAIAAIGADILLTALDLSSGWHAPAMSLLLLLLGSASTVAAFARVRQQVYALAARKSWRATAARAR